MNKPPFLLAFPLVAAALLGGVLPAYGKDVICQFQARSLSMSFGALNPASGIDVISAASAATLNADKAGDCQASQTMVISADPGPRLLRDPVSGDSIPYSLNGLPQSRPGPGNNQYVAFAFSGKILGGAYANVSAGSYFDTVMISVTP